MKDIMKILYATFDFYLIKIVASTITVSPHLSTWVWYALSVILAFALRLGIEYDNNSLTKRSLVKQTIYTVSWLFLSVLLYKEMQWKGWFEVYLFMNSLFGVFFVSQFESAFKETFSMGLKKWLRIKLNWLLAEDKEVKP